MALGYAPCATPRRRLMGSACSPGKSHRASAICLGGRHNGIAARLHQESSEDAKARFGFGKRSAETVEKTQIKKQNTGSNFDEFLSE